MSQSSLRFRTNSGRIFSAEKKKKAKVGGRRKRS
jgi:hypothetical protein